MEHTPGPWVATGYGKSGIGAQTLVYDQAGLIVADTRSSSRRTEEDAEANARLIAAAPELLDAAINMLAKINDMTTEEFRIAGEKAEREALTVAIDKATKGGE